MTLKEEGKLSFGNVPIFELTNQPRMVRDVDGDWVCECGVLVGAGMDVCMCGRAAPAFESGVG